MIGTNVARELKLSVGSRFSVNATSAFLLDAPSLQLRVAGILAPTESPDDDAILTHLKTTWILEGLGHGHSAGARHGTPSATPVSVITPENAATVHFHGDQNDFPISAVVVVPDSEKARTLLLGQYFSPDETAMITRPSEVIEALIAKVVWIRRYMVALVLIIGLVTLLTIGLVIMLSIRLRRDEISTISKMGCSRYTIPALLLSEIAFILTLSVVCVTVLSVLTDIYGQEIVKQWIL